jgi:ferritin-like metal-binding protein YciE
VDTDEKKQECFHDGLDDGPAYALEARDLKNFQSMVDKALVLEKRRAILSHKLKQEHQTQQNMNPMPRINVSS